MKWLITLAFLFMPLAAVAANCPGYSYVLTNGQTADANQVMANFNTIMNCANNNLASTTTVNGLAPLFNPTFSGTPRAPTGTAGDTSTQIATDGFVTNAVNTVLNGSNSWPALQAFPGGLQATTISGPNFGVRILGASGGGNAILQFTDNTATIQWGTITASSANAPSLTTATPSPGDNSSKIATTAFVQAATPNATTSVVGQVALATGAQVITGTDTTHAVTPASLTSSQSLASPGYIQLPGGLYLEWGVSGAIASNSSGTVTFAHACTTTPYSATVTPAANPGTGGMGYFWLSGINTSQMTINNQSQSGFSVSYNYQVICK